MDVFVYGTLTEPARVDEILDRWEFVGEATLVGLHRVDGTYPTLVPGGRVEGRLLRTAEIDRIDAYEGIESGPYVRVSVPCVSDDSVVAVYVGDPDRLDAQATWPGQGSFDERVRRYLKTHDVVVREIDDRQD